ncbi:MAG: ribosomal protein L31 [Paraglaciecola sp.]|jgi:ribosomal protein L31
MDTSKSATRLKLQSKRSLKRMSWLRTSSTVFALVFFVGCSATGQKEGHSVSNKANISLEKLVLVDCLLPGQVRKLGTQNTFVTPRQPARLNASECSIRGGEYTEYDRANLTSSINVWTPLAQKGDAKAQNYLGEIYEAGITGTPDYQLAALWYQRAVDQGFKAAQVNLGFLYESGKGVSQDKAKALNLYRLAADLKDDQLEYMSIIDQKVSEQLDRWKEKLSKSQNETNRHKSAANNLLQQLMVANSKLKKLTQDGWTSKVNPSNVSADTTQQLETLRVEKQHLIQKLSEQNEQIVTLRQEARQDRARMNYQIDGLNENQLSLAKKIGEKTVELTRVKALLLTASSRYQQEKVQYQQDSTNSIKSEDEKNYQANIVNQSIKLAELEQKIIFYKQQENIYQDNISLQRAELENNKNQNEEYKQLSQAQIDSLVLELKQTQSLVENNESRHQQLIAENKSIEDQLQKQLTLRHQDKTKNNALVSLLALKVGSLSDRHSQVIRLEEKVNQLNARLTGLNNLPQPVLTTVANRQEYSISTAANFDTGSDSLSNQFGEFHALIIGNDKYQYHQNLKTAVADAISIEEILSTQYGYKTTLLLNATRKDILSTLYTMQNELDGNKNLLVYYAGHGEMRNSKGHWLPVDAQISDQSNWIPTQQITDLISQFDARKIMIVADSCFSGVLTRSSILSPGIKIDVNNKKHLKWLNAMSKGKSRTVLTSGGLQPVLDGGGGEHSVFAKHFIAALDNNKSVIDAHTLYNRIFPGVKEDAITLNVEQSPQYAPIKGVNHHSVDYFFIREG